MGNIIHTRPPETSTLSVPLVRSPLSDVTAAIGHQDGNEECLPFQLRYIDCCEAYGNVQCRQKCKYYYQDYVECATQWKQHARISDMTAQHYHMWFKGLIGTGPKVSSVYYETPRYDAYAPMFQYWDKDTHY